ncbi:SO_0444 family Cu/Zn efflux transporter [Candidatus Zixiibacteriota bacterium]
MIEVLVQIVSEFWLVLSEMAPYLLFGFFVAGLLSVLISAETVERHLGGRGVWPIVKATLFGIPLPLCSCGVIPVAASLRQHGANRSATTAFLLSTPQTGVDSIMVTFSLLGPIFALFRPLAAFVTGLLGGSLVGLMESDDAAREAISGCTDECCSAESRGGRLTRIVRYGFVTLPKDIGKALLIGLLIAGLISALIPNDYLSGLLGAGIGAMIIMMLLGIPVYVCATASVPVAAALIAKGVSPGAALVFLMTGPATNAAAITTIWKIMGKRTASIYLLTVAITALASGLFLDYIFQIQGATTVASMPGMLPEFIKTGSAVMLLAVLAAAIWRPSRRMKSALPGDREGPKVTLSISGMTCEHCVRMVSRALKEVAGVHSADVDLKAGKARVEGENLNLEDLRRSVEELGYIVDKIEEKS